MPPQESIDACADEERVTRLPLIRASAMLSGGHGIYRDISTGVIEESFVMSIKYLMNKLVVLIPLK